MSDTSQKSSRYLNQGVSLRPGQGYDVGFDACQLVAFKVYTIILDSVDFYERAQFNANS